MDQGVNLTCFYCTKVKPGKNPDCGYCKRNITYFRPARMMNRSTSDLHILDLLTRLVNELNILRGEDIYPAQIFSNLEAYAQI